MRLTVVGCSGSFPGPDGPASSYLVEHAGFRLVLDMGNGALGAIQRYVDPRALDAVVLSHLHADHCLDMGAFAVALRFNPAGRRPPVPTYGPPGTSDRLVAAYGEGGAASLTDVFEFHEILPGRSRIGPFDVTFARMNHPVITYAVRLESDGASLVYSGDTGTCAALVELARGADVLLCEASFVTGGNNPGNLHLTGREAGEHAAEAEVGRLLVTHVPSWHSPSVAVAEAAETFDGPVEAVFQGAVYEL